MSDEDPIAVARAASDQVAKYVDDVLAPMVGQVYGSFIKSGVSVRVAEELATEFGTAMLRMMMRGDRDG